MQHSWVSEETVEYTCSRCGDTRVNIDEVFARDTELCPKADSLYDYPGDFVLTIRGGIGLGGLTRILVTKVFDEVKADV